MLLAMLLVLPLMVMLFLSQRGVAGVEHAHTRGTRRIRRTCKERAWPQCARRVKHRVRSEWTALGALWARLALRDSDMPRHGQESSSRCRSSSKTQSSGRTSATRPSGHRSPRLPARVCMLFSAAGVVGGNEGASQESALWRIFGARKVFGSSWFLGTQHVGWRARAATMKRPSGKHCLPLCQSFRIAPTRSSCESMSPLLSPTSLNEYNQNAFGKARAGRFGHGFAPGCHTF